jgi:uncharacterized membrane protein YbaN (DUF454 family)
MYLIKLLFLILGTISLVLGILGIFLPLLPTTPFLLLSAYLYFRSSERAYNWLITQKYLGPYIVNYREKKIIPQRVKVYTLVLLWACILYSIIFVVTALWLRLLLLAIAIGVTVHVLSFKSKE